MVGLPARGKTYMARKLCRYLSWLGYSAATFNVGNYRRGQVGSHVHHSFFDPDNEEGLLLRMKAAESALKTMASWLNEEEGYSFYSNPDDLAYYIAESKGKVAIYDATNSTKDRRMWIVQELLHNEVVESPSQILFIESICNDSSIINSNILQVKLSSPDYKDVEDPERSRLDFIKRIQHYENAYEPLSETEWMGLSKLDFYFRVRQLAPNDKNHRCWQGSGFVQLQKLLANADCILFDESTHYSTMHISLQGKLGMLMHGESEFNVQGRIGGDSSLSLNGRLFAETLPEWLKSHFSFSSTNNLVVWTSTLKRSIETAAHLPYPKLAWKALDEINAGICDGLRYEQIEEMFKDEYSARAKDKYYYRYPSGESYADLVLRLEPVIIELERQRDILVIGHQAVLRAIVAYFTGVAQDQLPYVVIPLHTIIELRPKAYGCEVINHPIGIPAVNTHRARVIT